MKKRGDIFAEKWHSVYFLMPVFEKSVTIPDLEIFQEALTQKFGRVEPLSDKPDMPEKSSDLLSFMLWDHQSKSPKESMPIPSQLIIYGLDTFEQELWDGQIISQFWDCLPDKEGFASRCKYSLMASNMMAAMLPVMEQYQIMADYADMLLDLFPDCIGIYWPHSQRLVPREAFQESKWKSRELHFLDGGLNVRFFNITGSDEMLFDTLGLTSIGLPDLQCHCKDLEPNDVVIFLRNLAAYLYQHGDVIEDGNTVEGIGGGKWICKCEDAMVGPMRMVLDICPGKYAGGGR